MPLARSASTFAFSLAESPWLKRISTIAAALNASWKRFDLDQRWFIWLGENDPVAQFAEG
jgi:hypothetical protein